ncbi:TIR domain-containing protein [Sabulibacter ruber]|uniref:TIR domain-containing protein n=1 Tax=Sabulibacter ruber TaxID=2811901 RepID=UPI001A975D9B|nr:TIR domain-containing protein [Sabulibacter ruber]
MGHKDRTYVIFDGDKDQWAYRYMRGWNNNRNIDFNFDDAHELKPLTYRAQDEIYIKTRLRERLKQTDQVILLIGESTKFLYKYVRWELELAIELNLPIIAVNLDKTRVQNPSLCPAIIRTYPKTVYVAFRSKIIQYALDNFPSFIRNYKGNETRWHYPDEVYTRLGI